MIKDSLITDSKAIHASYREHLRVLENLKHDLQ